MTDSRPRVTGRQPGGKEPGYVDPLVTYWWEKLHRIFDRQYDTGQFPGPRHGPTGVATRCSRTLSVAGSVGLAGCSNIGSLTGQSPAEQIQNHESGLERVTDVETAIEKGYRTTGTSVRAADGAIGVPFVEVEVSDLGPECVMRCCTLSSGRDRRSGRPEVVRTDGRAEQPSVDVREDPSPGRTRARSRSFRNRMRSAPGSSGRSFGGCLRRATRQSPVGNAFAVGIGVTPVSGPLPMI